MERYPEKFGYLGPTVDHGGPPVDDGLGGLTHKEGIAAVLRGRGIHQDAVAAKTDSLRHHPLRKEDEGMLVCAAKAGVRPQHSNWSVGWVFDREIGLIEGRNPTDRAGSRLK